MLIVATVKHKGVLLCTACNTCFSDAFDVQEHSCLNFIDEDQLEKWDFEGNYIGPAREVSKISNTEMLSIQLDRCREDIAAIFNTDPIFKRFR